MRKMKENEAIKLMEKELERGWIPPSVEDLSCNCINNPPCSKCCLDGDYLDEFLEQFNIEIK